MVGLSDDLAKLDTYVEAVTRKIAHYLAEVLEDQRDKLPENLLANQSMYTLIFICFVLKIEIVLSDLFQHKLLVRAIVVIVVINIFITKWFTANDFNS